MEDILTTVSRLRRPKMLVRTARHGIEHYDRVIHLRRLLKTEALPGPGNAILRLIEHEATVNTQRQEKRAEYSVARHVELLVALMCETRVLKASRARSLAKAP